MIRRGAWLGVALLLGTLVPAVFGAASAGALPVSVPTATACAGGASLLRPVPSAGTTISMRADMACGTHWVIFAGNAVPSTLEDICSENLVSLTFVGTESVDYAQPTATHATWTLQGRAGSFIVTTDDGAGGAKRVGTMLAGGCDQYGASGELVLAQATTAGSLPDAFLCHATVSVTPQNIYSGSGGWEIVGPATGTGTCQSTSGDGTLQLNGTWTLVGSQPCSGSVYNFDDALFSGRWGQRSVAQGWGEVQGKQLMTSEGAVLPSGGGRLVETPDPCDAPSGALPPPFQATADWAFVVA